jgi:hypothetical protein
MIRKNHVVFFSVYNLQLSLNIYIISKIEVITVFLLEKNIFNLEDRVSTPFIALSIKRSTLKTSCDTYAVHFVDTGQEYVPCPQRKD